MPKPDLRPLLTTTDLAKRWQMNPASLENWRIKKIGPPYVKVGNKVRFRPEDVEAYERENSRLVKGRK